MSAISTKMEPDGFGVGISSLTPNYGHEDKANGEVFKCYVHLFHYSGHNNINVCNCNQINVIMTSLNCMIENLLEMVSSCYGMKLNCNLYLI